MRKSISYDDFAEIKKSVKGDGENTRGLEIRMALVEKDIGLIKWASIVAAGAVIINLIQQFFFSVFKH